MDLLGIGSVIESVGKVAEHFVTTDKEKMAMEIEMRKLDQALDMAQLAVNTEEAKSSSVFVSGWRPAIGWICAAALGYQYVFAPLALWLSQIIGRPMPAPPMLDDVLWQLMFGILGMGGLRTLEKFNGVAAR